LANGIRVSAYIVTVVREDIDHVFLGIVVVGQIIEQIDRVKTGLRDSALDMVLGKEPPLWHSQPPTNYAAPRYVDRDTWEMAISGKDVSTGFGAEINFGDLIGRTCQDLGRLQQAKRVTQRRWPIMVGEADSIVRYLKKAY
jgi:hypothetical protein